MEAIPAGDGDNTTTQVALGRVELSVSDLARSLDFYQRSIGLELLASSQGQAELGTAGRAWVRLIEEPEARPSSGHTGLFHLALLLPERRDLARWLTHALAERIPLTGAADHFVSEAVYLDDPDGHGIEIYRDRPRSRWKGRVDRTMTTEPLDLQGVLVELQGERSSRYPGLPAGTTMGHVHLKVASIPETVAFYRDLLGFEVMARYGSEAVFFARNGYHHHVGANTWQSQGASPPPAGAAALQRWVLTLPNPDSRAPILERLLEAGIETGDHPEGPEVADPSGNRVVLSVA